MKISIAADHAGYRLKERLRDALLGQGHEVVDRGAWSEESCDYPDLAVLVARDVAEGRAERGILICRTGSGMAMAANKVPGVRAAVGFNSEAVRLARSHNDANVLALGARFVDAAQAAALAEAFLTTTFEGGRHARRLAKIAELEREFQRA